jgi:sterol desaturase/sphingolipid hydroxylase (fatty acid hydroxylase superfamily)
MTSGATWWYVFASAFTITGVAEAFRPIRSLSSSTTRRWTSNSILLALSGVVAILAYQVSGIALAFSIQADHYGLLNRLAAPYAARAVIGLAALDLTRYGSHRLFHRITPLWRVHQVHHSETDLDLTTGLRFHPIEPLIGQGFMMITIALLGLPPSAFAAYGLIVIVQDFFDHANVQVPEKLNRALGLVFITPAMHHMHHSDQVQEQNANFGTIFSFWDRLFGTCNAVTASVAQQTRCGVAEIANGSEMNAVSLLALPFRNVTKENTLPAVAQSTQR